VPQKKKARYQQLTSVILATWETEIRRIMVQSQPGQIVWEILSQKYPIQKRTGRVTQMVDCLPTKCKALSSNTSIAINKTTTTKKKIRGREEGREGGRERKGGRKGGKKDFDHQKGQYRQKAFLFWTLEKPHRIPEFQSCSSFIFKFQAGLA
jgi:hypothetical protein